jgi:alkylation response protein AidB-like acyl-CoA dehydrogenase
MDVLDKADPVARARELADPIADAAATIEQERRIPGALLDRLHEARLFRMLLPRSVGGDEVEPGTYLRAVEETGRHDGSVAWCLFQACSSSLLAAYLAPEVARTIFADPRAVMSWGPPSASKAAAAPGGYRVSGRWNFSSGCRHATWLGAHCQVVESDGSLRLNAAGRPTVRTLLFPAGAATIIDAWDVIGLRGTASDGYTLTDLFVPEAFSTTREDPTLRREPGRLYAFTMQGLYTVGAAGVALGLARAMLDAFMALAGHKTPRALAARLADNAFVQTNVAQFEAKLQAARAWLLDTLAAVWARADATAPIDIPDRALVRLAAVHAIQTSIEVADYSYRAAGSDAIFADRAFERRFRDMHTLSQQTQGRMANFEAVGQVLLGVVPEGGFL